jgi:hypothetical protein
MVANGKDLGLGDGDGEDNQGNEEMRRGEYF